jgi:hypothetical protein
MRLECPKLSTVANTNTILVTTTWNIIANMYINTPFEPYSKYILLMDIPNATPLENINPTVNG